MGGNAQSDHPRAPDSLPILPFFSSQFMYFFFFAIDRAKRLSVFVFKACHSQIHFCSFNSVLFDDWSNSARACAVQSNGNLSAKLRVQAVNFDRTLEPTRADNRLAIELARMHEIRRRRLTRAGRAFNLSKCKSEQGEQNDRLGSTLLAIVAFDGVVRGEVHAHGGSRIRSGKIEGARDASDRRAGKSETRKRSRVKDEERRTAGRLQRTNRIRRLIRHTRPHLLLHFDDHLAHAHDHAIANGESDSSVTG